MEMIKIIGLETGINDVFAIRNAVFVNEQNVPAEMEKDEIDAFAGHIIAMLEKQPVGTGRVFKDPSNEFLARMGRIAVLKEFRGQGIGRLITNHLIEIARQWGCKSIKIHSQKHVEKMYELFGFKAEGDEFMEAGILHVEMVLTLK